MKNIFDGLISRLDIAEEGISELEGYIKRILENRKAKRTKIGKKTRTEYPRTVG